MIRNETSKYDLSDLRVPYGTAIDVALAHPPHSVKPKFDFTFESVEDYYKRMAAQQDCEL